MSNTIIIILIIVAIVVTNLITFIFTTCIASAKRVDETDYFIAMQNNIIDLFSTLCNYLGQKLTPEEIKICIRNTIKLQNNVHQIKMDESWTEDMVDGIFEEIFLNFE